MFEIVHHVYYNSAVEKRLDHEWHTSHPRFDAALIEQIQNQFQDDHPVVLINAQAHLPPHWETRLLQPLLADRELAMVSALTLTEHDLSPLHAGTSFGGDLSALDHAIYLLQEPHWFLTEATNPHCSAARSAQHLSSTSNRCAVNNLLVDVPVDDSLQSAQYQLDIGDQRPLPAHPLAALQIKLINTDFSRQASGYPGLDEKPTALHVVMDWGGGVHQWLNDFTQTHDHYNHLILVSQGEFFRHRQGEKFQLLWQHSHGPELQQFHLAAPIVATTPSHPEYQALLRQVINRWDIRLLVVSSVIGHAMDCLNTGLPTLRVLHDYFPHWPSLNARLDQDVIDASATEQALTASADEPFGLVSAEQLTQWQQATNELLQQNHVKIVAPDPSVRDNLLKLPHAQCYQATHIIPHGTTPLAGIDYQAHSQPVKLLVLGRMTAGKGQQLIHDCIQQLAEHDIEWILLGAGKGGQAFTSYPQVSVIEDYEHDQLTQTLSEISPQLAVLASVTSETFSYTLSELQMSGIPVVSTTLGALKNRIRHGVDGWLCAADAQAMVEQIRQTIQQPQSLLAASLAAKEVKQASLQDSKQAYQNLLAGFAIRASVYQPGELTLPPDWAQQLQLSQQHNERLHQNLTEVEKNLAEKTAWGQELTRHNQHLTDNLNLEKQEVEQHKVTIEQQQATFEALRKQLQQDLNASNQQLKLTEQDLQEAQAWGNRLSAEKEQLSESLATTRDQLNNTEAERQAALAQVTAMRSSRSWRLTKPLRRFTTYARHKRNAIKFRFNQLKGLPKRVSNSIKTRGLKQTAQMAKNKLKKPPVKTVVAAHEVVEQYQALHLECSPEPLVSVVVPVYNHFKHTYHCLESLARLPDETAFEVIVVDDCSTDHTQEQIKLVTGIHYHRQTVNGGFIESCNTGASLAKGQYLLFLNNDTEVMAGWLDELVKTFDQQADAGLVGSQLLYPDGRLQEAGGIVFADASGWNYGRLDQPDAPAYQHLRQVSYISGASIMISRQLFTDLGQFDDRYKPAYYEDTDLAFAVRQAGKKVYYQPLSKVIHFEGISSGTDLSSGTKKYQVINQQKFLDKWQTALQQQPQPGTDIELARFQNQPRRVLILDACTPTPDQDSGSLRMMNLMQIFIELGYQVSFVPENMAHFESYTLDLQRLGVACIYAPKYNSPLDYLNEQGAYFDVVILSRYYVAEPVMSMIRSYCPKAQIWFDTVDLHYLRETRMAELDGDAQALKNASKTKEKELAVAAGCDLTLVVSPYEQEVLAEEQPALKVDVLSNIHEVYGSQNGFEQRQDMLFIGGYQHTPNVDGILWFVEHILPLICATIPDIKLHVIGSKAPPQVVALGEHPNIEFHGFVEDIQPYMQNIRLAVAPLRFGAGVKGKVNMSMSCGQPVVGTKVAVEGMYTTHGQDVMMAEEPQAFAAEVVRIYQDQVLWEQVSAGGLANVQRWFSFAAAKNKVASLLE